MSHANPLYPQTSDPREFWKPQRPISFRVDKCESCGNEMVMGSRFCHLCGSGRDAHLRPVKLSVAELFDWGGMRDRFGLSTASMLLFIVGTVFVLAALATGILFTAATQTEWEAIQMWRIEWMLAALVALAAALLLKK